MWDRTQRVFHWIAAVFTEFREGGTVISAMLTGSKYHEHVPLDGETSEGGTGDRRPER